MHVMEGRVGSGVLKKKNSSGCLIIKKTGANLNSGRGLGGLGDGSKGKKRARLVATGSDSSSSSSSDDDDDDESLEFMRRKVNKKRLKRGHDRDSAGIDVSGEKKRSRLELFDFDEYDEFDGQKMRNEFLQDRFKRGGRNDGGNVKDNSNTSLVDKRKKGSYFKGSGSGGSKNVGGSGARSKELESEDDEARMPISVLRTKYQETAGESIRLQGKNGVLKVMVNKKKKMDFPSQHKNHDPAGKDSSPELPVFPHSKTPRSRGLLGCKERSSEKEKGEMKMEKVTPNSNKNRKTRDSGVDETDTVLKLATPRPQASSSKKAVKFEVERSPSTENIPSIKGKESNAKRGGSTEKQMLREKIRGMLIDAGWSIDYRPRRNRDYLDAVYINPSGTAYWSIIKAYDAFKKHLGEDSDKVRANVGSPSVAPLSEDLINKLTRQTKKKIAEEMKRKRKEDSTTKSAKKSAVKESSDSDQSEDRLSSYVKQNQKLRGKLSKVDQDSNDDLSDDSQDRRPRRVKFEKSSTASKSNSIQGRTSKVIGRCTLLVRGSDRGDNSAFDGYVPYKGKRTVLAWLIDCGTAKLSEKVQYMNRRRTRVMLEGWVTRDGIHCGCCSKILTVSKFELHAGSKLRQPFQNIFLESGSSLLQCQIDAWNNQDESLHRDFFTVSVDGDDPDDDTCAICGDGGDLICCDSCPSTFHQICLGIQMLPSGDWHCPNCICKFCGFASGNVAEETDISCDELNICNLCEKKYHRSCSERAHPQPLNSCRASFCGLKCQEIYDHLQKIIGVKNELEAGISWSIIQRTDVSDASHRGFPLRVECNSKLAVALSVMDECFLPIIDRRSGINIIHNVVYNCGSNFNRLNYRGFYTAVLERGDEILAAASIRLHGDRLAEMPFIGTREIYRRQGMCRRLLSALETELCSLKVGQLIIPAISEHINTWTTIFGFHELEDTHKKEIKSMNMLVFPGTDMLQKEIVKQEYDGVVAPELTKNQPSSPALVEKSEASLSEEENKRSSSDSGGCPTFKSCDEVDALDSASPVPVIPLDAHQETGDPAPNNTSNVVCESVNLKCSPIPAEDGNISDKEHGYLETPNSPVKAVVENDHQETPVKMVTDDVRESVNLKCSPIPAEDDNISDKEHVSLGTSNSLVKAVVEDDHQETDDINNTSGALCGSVNLKCCSIPAEDGNISGEEHGSLETSNSLVKAVVEDACKIEDCGKLKSAVASAIKNGFPVSEDAAHSKTMSSNGCVKLFPTSVPEASAEVNNVASNGDHEESVVALNADLDDKTVGGDGVYLGFARDTHEHPENDDHGSDHKAFEGDSVNLGVVPDTPDGVETDEPESDHKAIEKDGPDHAETGKPDSDKAFEGDGTDPSVVRDTPDGVETDEPESDHKAIEKDGPDHAETGKPNSDKAFEGDGTDPSVVRDTPDLAETDEPNSDREFFEGAVVQDTPDRAETDEPESDHKDLEGDGVDAGVVQDTPDRAETYKIDSDRKEGDGVDPGVVQDIPDRAETDELDGESK